MQLAEAKAQAEKLEGQQLTLKVKTGETGKLFGAVTNKEIADLLHQQFGYELDKKKIVLSEPIKQVGSYTVELKPYANVSCKITVTVESL